MEAVKICTCCGVEQPNSEFTKDKNRKDGLFPQCKTCSRKYRARPSVRESKKKHDAKYRAKPENKEKQQKYHEQWRERNHEDILERARNYRETPERQERLKGYWSEYYDKNKEAMKERTIAWNKVPENKERKRIGQNKRRAIRRKEDILFKLTDSLRSATRRIFRLSLKDRHTEEVLGCPFDEAISYICLTFYDSVEGTPMTIDSLLRSGEVEIDHIVPLCSANTQEELISLGRIENLQLLWRWDNSDKGYRLDWIHPLNRNKDLSQIKMLSAHPNSRLNQCKFTSPQMPTSAIPASSHIAIDPTWMS